MQHLDEGTIHAWLDGALSAEESARVEAHVASCESCGAAVAEARGLVAASSRILSALDNVPRNVIPVAGGAPDTKGATAPARGKSGGVFRRWEWKRIAAVIAFVAVGGTALRIAVGERDRVSEANAVRMDTMAKAPSASMEPRSLPAEEHALKMGATVPNPSERDEVGAAAQAPRPAAPPPAAAIEQVEKRTADAQSAELSAGASANRSRQAFVAPQRADSAPSVVTGRVIDARTGNAIASAQVVLEGTRMGAITNDSGAFRIAGAPQGEQQLRVLRVGYESQERGIETKAGETVSVDVALEPRSAMLDRVAVTSTAEAAALAKPVSSTIVGLQALRRDTVVESGRMVETSIYELRPGVLVTLSVSTPAPAERDAEGARAKQAEPVAPPAPAPVRRESPRIQLRGKASANLAMPSIRWVSPGGADVTLSGQVSEEELRTLRQRVVVP